MELCDVVLRIRVEVAAVLEFFDRSGYVGRQLPAVRWRYERVLRAVPDLDRDCDVRDVKALRLDERELVIDPAVHALTHCFGEVLAQGLPELRFAESLPILVSIPA